MRNCLSIRMLFASSLLSIVVSGAAEPKSFKIDTVHSTVIFKVLHLNAGNAYGRFNDIQGEVVYDDESPEKSAVNITVKADSIDTANAKRDEHLRSPDFLNAAEFPNITFKSNSAKKLGEKEFELAGDLTLHGVTKPVTARLVHIGSVPDPRAGGIRAGAEARFTIKQSDFGMKPKGVGDEVDIIVSTEAIGK